MSETPSEATSTGGVVTPASSIPARGRSRLGRSAILVTMMTSLSRITGFARDVMIAQLFGAVGAVDAFWIAFRIPNFLRRLFAEGAFQQAFVPVLSQYRETKPQEEVQRFVDLVAGLLALSTFIITLIAMLAAPLIVALFAPGFIQDSARFELTTTMIRYTFPYLIFISLTAFTGSILNCYGRFALPAFTPVMLNVAMIACALLLKDYFREPIIALALGVFVGGLVQLAMQLPALRGLKLFPRPRVSLQHAGVNQVLKLMVPAIFGVSVAQIGLLLDTMFASFLPTGSVSWLTFSDRLTAFPLGIFGVGVATVILPLLSRKFTQDSLVDFNSTLQWATRIIIVISLPAAVGLIVLAGPILATLFGYGEFTGHDVIMTRLSLMALSVGIPAFMLVKILAAGFYAQQDIRTPVRYAVIAIVANIVLNIIFIVPFAHMGLALATSLASCINVALLLWGLYRKRVIALDNHTRIFILRVAIATLLMSMVLWWMVDPLHHWLAWEAKQRVGHLSVLLIAAMITFFTTLVMLGARWRHIRPPV